VATFHHLDVEVFNGAVAAAWATLDLTLQSDGVTPSGLPAARSVALLACTPDPAGPFPWGLYTRPTWDAPVVWFDSMQERLSKGTAQLYFSAASRTGLLVVPTDAAGQIDVYSDLGGTCALNLYGYIDAEQDFDVVFSGIPGAAFANLDLSAVVGANRALAFLRSIPTVSPIQWTLRTKERPEEVTVSADADVVFGVESAVNDNIDCPSLVATVTDQLGIVEHRQEAPAGGELDLLVVHHVIEHAGWVHVNRVLTYERPTYAFQELDLSGLINGQRRVLAFIKVLRVEAALITPVQVSFRPGDEGGDWVTGSATRYPFGATSAVLRGGQAGRFLVPTDERGCVDWRAGAPGELAVNFGSCITWLVGYVDSGLLGLTRLWQSSLNTVDIELDHEPRHLDPADPRDALYLPAYTVTGPASPARLVQAVTYVGDNTLRLWFDGELVEGASYSLSITGLVSIEGFALSPDPMSGSFVAYGPDRRPVPLREHPAARFDLRNPQVERDAPVGEPLGTFVIDTEGDLDIEGARAYLRKRIFRRLSTRRGTMLHEPGYGLLLRDAGLYRPAALRALQQDIEAQLRAEPDVRSARATVSQLAPGVVYCRLKVTDDLGLVELDMMLRGEE